MKLTVDRITEGIAVCETEDENMVRIRAELLPAGTKEGSVLVEENGVYTLDAAEAADRRKTLFDLQNALFAEEDADLDEDDDELSADADDADVYGWDE